MEGTDKPDYSACVDISTRAALREMILPGAIAIIAPILLGVLLGPASLAGLLVGSTLTGVLVAIQMANAGGAWDNAKNTLNPVRMAARALKHTRRLSSAIPSAIRSRILPARL